MYNYAQIDANGVCVGVSTLSGEVTAPNLIPLPAADYSCLGKQWDGVAFVGTPQAQRTMSKYEFRQLLSPVQKLVWDNFDVLKDALGLTTEQYMLMRSFRADFDAAQDVDLDNPLIVSGLNAIASWGLVYNGEDVFTQVDVNVILGGGA